MIERSIRAIPPSPAPNISYNETIRFNHRASVAPKNKYSANGWSLKRIERYLYWWKIIFEMFAFVLDRRQKRNTNVEMKSTPDNCRT